jgi:hypothetical protein
MAQAQDTLELGIVVTPGPCLIVGAAETIPHWRRGARLALGFWTFSMPVIAAGLGVASMLVSVEVPPGLLAAVYGFLVAHFIIAMFYVAFAGQNPRLRSPAAWQLAIVLAGPVTILVYWIVHVWFAPYADDDAVSDAPIPHRHDRDAFTSHGTLIHPAVSPGLR